MALKRKTTGQWLSWLPVILWMGLIFFFSAQTGMQSGALSGGITARLVAWLVPNWEGLSAATQQETLAFVGLLVRKCAHFTEFAVLGGLLLNAWFRWQRHLGWRQAAFASLCGLLCAAGDEFHQMFVPARGPAVTDVLIDFGGVLTGLLVDWLLLRRHKT